MEQDRTLGITYYNTCPICDETIEMDRMGIVNRTNLEEKWKRWAVLYQRCSCGNRHGELGDEVEGSREYMGKKNWELIYGETG